MATMPHLNGILLEVKTRVGGGSTGTGCKGIHMTEFYIVLAVFLAVSLNQSSRVLRALGTLTAALALAMIAWSIIIILKYT